MIPYEEIQLLTSIKGEESQAGEAGASGKVVKGLWRGNVVAVKLMHFQNVENFEPGWRQGIQDVNESKKREIEKEAENYSKLNHPNIIKFYGLTRVGNCVNIVIEYVEGGSLQELIDRTVKKIELLDAVKKIQIALDVAVGVNYLHVDQEMVHRDLKPQNILICEGYRAKLCDFGSARNVGSITLQNVGTMLYAAPEVFKQKGEKMGSYAADVYCFGVVFWCLFFEIEPPGIKESCPPRTIPKVACEKKTAKAVVAVVKECCVVKPEKRTKMKKVVGKLEKMLEDLKRRNYQNVVNEVDRLKSEFSQREAALKSNFAQREALLKSEVGKKEIELKSKFSAREAVLKSEVAKKEAVLNSKIVELQKGLKAKDNEIRNLGEGLVEKENENKKLEKLLKQAQKEAADREMENIKLKRNLERGTKKLKVRKEANITKTPKSKKLKVRKEAIVTQTPTSKESNIVVKEKRREMGIKPSSVSVPRGFKSQRGIMIPQNVVFEMNERYRSELEKMFSNGNKGARGISGQQSGEGRACFKASVVFTAGKRFYFEVSANVGHGTNMGFGILSGEVATWSIGDHEKGWEYYCYPGTKSTYHNWEESSGYGPKRTKGKHKFGVVCDFTNGKGEVSFIVDGKNWGVAYKNVKPPVSPAFYLYKREDSFKIEDTFELPNCELETGTNRITLVRKTPKRKPKKPIILKEKQREMEMLPSSITIPKVVFKSKRGILVPKNVVFEVNDKFRSKLERMFSNGNKVAKGVNRNVCFKTSAVFTSGKKFYFQVSANVGYGVGMGFGILSGEVTTNIVGYHEKGWDYYCAPWTKLTHHNSQQSIGYGPEGTKGKQTLGIFCDFTNGKGEVSFIVDGRNWGVAFKNVKPPVSPAFYLWKKGDSFKIEDTFNLPNCELETVVKGMKASNPSSKKPKSKEKESIVVKEKQREVEMLPSSVAIPGGFKSKRGILIPQNVVFKVNGKYRSELKRVFSNGNKVAGGTYNCVCFKSSTLFTAGKKFYFQVSANVGNGDGMGFGIMSGEVTKHYVGGHKKGWSYYCAPGNPPKLTFHNKQLSSGYGPTRTKGKHTFGIFCDFTDGKGELSFIVDGENWGVAYDNVGPPVSPAFYIYRSVDSFKMEDNFKLSYCLY